MKYQDYYEILGVSRTASQADIKKAYRNLSKKYHPDRNQDPAAEEKFKKIGEAYQIIGDAEKRAKYDSLGSGFHHGDQFRPPSGWGDVHFNFDSAFGGARPGGAMSDFGDFFEMFFQSGGASRGSRPRQRTRQRSGFENPFGPQGAPRGKQGKTQETDITITLEDAYHGAVRQISLTSTVREPSGGQRKEQKTFDVKIPPGTTHGKKIRLKGQGGKGLGGGPPGDLLLKVQIAPHPRFQTEEHDVNAELPLAPWEAALGAKVAFQTLDGEIQLTIPKGSQSGRILRLKGKGLPKNKTERGDMHIKLKITVPDELSSREQELFEELAQISPFNPRG